MASKVLPDNRTLDKLAKNPVKIAIVGHTNVGKSSVMKTLSHDPELKLPIGAEAGLTKKSAKWELSYAGRTYMVLYDTPGLERAEEIYENCVDGLTIDLDKVLDYLNHKGYLKDRRALETAKECDFLLYVADVKQKPTDEVQCELDLFNKTRKVIGVFNFVGVKDGYPKEWRKTLRDVGIHEHAPYDAHHFELEHEYKLLDRLLASCEPGSLHETALRMHKYLLQLKVQERTRLSAILIADCLCRCATREEYKADIAEKDRKKYRNELKQRLQNKLEKEELKCLEKLLELHGFSKRILKYKPFSLKCKKKENSNKLQRAGVGSAVGAGIGFLVAGPPGAAIGAAAGAGAGVALIECKYEILVQINKEQIQEFLTRLLGFLYQVQRRGLADESSPFPVPQKCPQKLEANLKKNECDEKVKELVEKIEWLGKLYHGRGKDISTKNKQQVEEKLLEIMHLVGIWGAEGQEAS